MFAKAREHGAVLVAQLLAMMPEGGQTGHYARMIWDNTHRPGAVSEGPAARRQGDHHVHRTRAGHRQQRTRSAARRRGRRLAARVLVGNEASSLAPTTSSGSGCPALPRRRFRERRQIRATSNGALNTARLILKSLFSTARLEEMPSLIMHVIGRESVSPYHSLTQALFHGRDVCRIAPA